MTACSLAHFCESMLVDLVQHTSFNIAISKQGNKSFVVLTHNSVNVVRFLKQSAFVVFVQLLTRVLVTSTPVLHRLRNRRKIDRAHRASSLTVNMHRLVAEKDRCSNVSPLWGQRTDRKSFLARISEMLVYFFLSLQIPAPVESRQNALGIVVTKGCRTAHMFANCPNGY